MRRFDVPGHITLNDVKHPAPAETREQRAWRLAQKAVIEGVRILEEPRSGELFATSGHNERTIYRLDLAARRCTCPASTRFGLCKHLALALAESGGLTPPEPANAEPAHTAAHRHRPAIIAA